jgi:hypothetical protein
MALNRNKVASRLNEVVCPLGRNPLLELAGTGNAIVILVTHRRRRKRFHRHKSRRHAPVNNSRALSSTPWMVSRSLIAGHRAIFECGPIHHNLKCENGGFGLSRDAHFGSKLSVQSVLSAPCRDFFKILHDTDLRSIN